MRLGKFDSDKKKPRMLMLALSTEQNSRLALAKAFARRRDLNDPCIFVLHALSKEDSKVENFRLKNGRQLPEQNMTREKLKIRNRELNNDGVKVAIQDPVNESWLGFLNILQIMVRNLVNFDRRMKFANAITLSDYRFICICETWLNEKMSRLKYCCTAILYTAQAANYKKTQIPMVVLAIKNRNNCELLKTDQPDCSLTFKREINRQIFYNFFVTLQKGTDTYTSKQISKD